MLLLSIAVCTRNRAKYLDACLNALNSQSVEMLKFEVIVVDNGSTDNTYKIANKYRRYFYNFNYYYEEKPGLSVARNRAIHEANGKLIAFLDDDAVPNKDWIENIATCWEKYKPDCFGGEVTPIWGSDRPIWLTSELESYYSLLSYSKIGCPMKMPKHPWGVNIVFNKEILIKVGGFPENLGRIGNNLLSGEEMWVCHKIHELGRLIWYEPDIKVQHHVPIERLNINWLRKRIFWGGVSAAIYYVNLNDIDKSKYKYIIFNKTLKLLLRPRLMYWMFVSLFRPVGIRKAQKGIYRLGFIFAFIALRFQL